MRVRDSKDRYLAFIVRLFMAYRQCKCSYYSSALQIIWPKKRKLKVANGHFEQQLYARPYVKYPHPTWDELVSVMQLVGVFHMESPMSGYYEITYDGKFAGSVAGYGRRLL